MSLAESLVKLAQIDVLTGRTGAGKTTLSRQWKPEYDLLVQTDMPRPLNKETGQYDDPTPKKKLEIRADRLDDILTAHLQGKKVLVEGHPPGIVKLLGPYLSRVSNVFLIPMTRGESEKRVISRAESDPGERSVALDLESAEVANDKFDKYLGQIKDVHSIREIDAKVKAAAKKTAVIVLGNPKYVEGNQHATHFYESVADHLRQHGFHVTMDPGAPHTLPPKADLWVGHSRGVDRLQYAPKGTRTVALGSNEAGAYNHPGDWTAFRQEKGPLAEGKQPPVEHFILTDEMKHGLIKTAAIEAPKLAPKPTHQEHLDNHFVSDDPKKWRTFGRNLRAKSFVEAVQQDPRADEKLKQFADMIGRHKRHKGPVTQVGNHHVKYHKDIDRYSCSCGDWTFRKAPLKTGDCKHITQVKEELSTAKVASPLHPLHALRAVHMREKGRVAEEHALPARVMNRAYESEFGKKPSIAHRLFKQAALRGQAAGRILAG